MMILVRVPRWLYWLIPIVGIVITVGVIVADWLTNGAIRNYLP